MRKATVMSILLLLLSQTGCALHSPERTIRGFFTATAHGELDEALSLLSAHALALGKDKLRAGLANVAQQAASMGGLQSVEIENLVVNGQTASAVAVLKYGNGTVSRQNVQLIQEDHQWKIDLHK